jgi:L-amino acid N-acyltransferase YncA
MKASGRVKTATLDAVLSRSAYLVTIVSTRLPAHSPGATSRESTVTEIRLTTTGDAAAIAAVYEQAVTNSAISFEVVPPSPDEMSARISTTLAFTPWLVCASGSHVLGYAYASKHRDRAAYQWSVEVSAYVRADHHGRGVGAALYTSLLAVLRLQGFRNAYAGITLPNPASVALHSKLGFARVGVFEKVGFKAGAWHDVLWLHREIAPRDGNPEAPTALPALLGHPDCRAAITQGLPLIAGRLPSVSTDAQT